MLFTCTIIDNNFGLEKSFEKSNPRGTCKPPVSLILDILDLIIHCLKIWGGIFGYQVIKYLEAQRTMP